MIDAKMRKTLSGLGGAFCLLCHANKDTASWRGVDEPEDYFTINRTGVEIKRKFDDLEKKRDGSVMTTRGDYKDRLGVTQPPIMQDTNALETLVFVSPLHALFLYHHFMPCFCITTSCLVFVSPLHALFLYHHFMPCFCITTSCLVFVSPLHALFLYHHFMPFFCITTSCLVFVSPLHALFLP